MYVCGHNPNEMNPMLLVLFFLNKKKSTQMQMSPLLSFLVVAFLALTTAGIWIASLPMEDIHLVPAAGRPVVRTVGFFDLASKVYTTSLSLLDMVIMKATKLTEEISVSSSAAQLKVAIPVAVASKLFGHKMMSPLKLDIEMKILYSFIVWHGVKCTLGDRPWADPAASLWEVSIPVFA